MKSRCSSRYFSAPRRSRSTTRNRASTCAPSPRSASHRRRWSRIEFMLTLDPAISWVVALGTAALFMAAAVHKLRDYSRFIGALGDYRMLPAAAVPLAAPVVVALEAGAAVLVAWP